MQVLVHPGADLAYASMVLDGFTGLFGSDAVRYATDGFDPKFGTGRFIALCRADDPAARAFVSLHDHARPNALARSWASVYAMVNITEEDAAAGRAIPIGPLFGVRLRSHALTARHVTAAARFAARRDGPRAAAAVVAGAWKHSRRRLPIAAYDPGVSDPDYVFFAAWPWAKHPEVNPPRAAFVEACRRAPGLTFEGGFAPRRRDDVPGVASTSAPRRYPMAEYLAKQRRSAVAFNNPAVHGCLGWKLGEFLALGKAIVTLPLGRALPAPLEHGVHVHVVDPADGELADGLDDAIARLRADDAYRAALEREARRWYDQHLAPEAVARRLLDALTATGPAPGPRC